jgi:hypothetical protein
MPTEREITLYYFTSWEAGEMLGRPSRQTLNEILRQGKVEAVKYHNQWMIRPDQIPILRGMISYSTMRKAA